MSSQKVRQNMRQTLIVRSKLKQKKENRKNSWKFSTVKKKQLLLASIYQKAAKSRQNRVEHIAKLQNMKMRLTDRCPDKKSVKICGIKY